MTEIRFPQIDSVRQRPAMYIGSKDHGGLQRMLEEVLALYLDQVVRGVTAQIEISLHTDGSCSIHCQGVDFPFPSAGANQAPELVKAGTRFPRSELFPGGWGACRLCYLGCGLVGANALAEWLEITVRAGSQVYRQRFERGYPAGTSTRCRQSSAGSTFHWLPDRQIFGSTAWHLPLLCNRLKTLSFLAPAARFSLTDKRSGYTWQFHEPTGLAALVERLHSGRVALHAPVCLDLEENWGRATLALQYHCYWPCGYDCGFDASSEVLGFANLRPAVGAHIRALAGAMTQTMNRFARRSRQLHPDEPDLSWPDVRTNLRAAISVVVDRPQWRGKYRNGLDGEHLAISLEEALIHGLERAMSRDEAPWREAVFMARMQALCRPRRERDVRVRRGSPVHRRT